jgi:hypothetical protein
MKFASAALGGMLAVTSVASAGVVENYFVASASGNASYGFNDYINGSDPFFASGNTSSVSIDSDTDGGGWGDGAYASVTASNTSSKSGDNYAWSGSMSATVQYLSDMDGATGVVSSQIRFTLDATTDVSMALSWMVTSQTDSSTNPSGQFGLFDRIGDQLQSELLGEWGGTSNESLTGTMTLGPGEYYFFFQLNNQVMYTDAFAGNNQRDLTFQASLNFGGGGGGGGAVPGLGALAPLAAAGLTRRRRR